MMWYAEGVWDSGILRPFGVNNPHTFASRFATLFRVFFYILMYVYTLFGTVIFLAKMANPLSSTPRSQVSRCLTKKGRQIEWQAGNTEFLANAWFDTSVTTILNTIIVNIQQMYVGDKSNHNWIRDGSGCGHEDSTSSEEAPHDNTSSSCMCMTAKREGFGVHIAVSPSCGSTGQQSHVS